MAPDKTNWFLVSLTKLSLLLVPLLMGIVVFEVLVRMTGTDVNPNPNWRYHPVLGWSQEPNAHFDYVVSGEEVHVEFNSLGFRDIERKTSKPEGSRRVVVIGDSFCEAVQVNLRDTFHQRLQNLLNQAGEVDWEVINLGVGDFGTAQELIALNEYGLEYEPDIVVLQIFPLNDVCNNSIGLSGLCKSPNDPFRPYYIEVDEKLVLTSAQPVRNFLRRTLASYGVLELAALTYLWPSQSLEDEDYRRSEMISRGYPPVDPLLATYVPEPEQIAPIRAGWHILERILEELVGLAAEHDFVLVPLVLPFEIRVSPDWEKFVAATPDLRMCRSYPEQRLSEVCRSLNLDPVIMLPVFEKNLHLFLPGRDGHLNPKAHRMVAEEIFSHLSDHGLIG